MRREKPLSFNDSVHKTKGKGGVGKGKYEPYKQVVFDSVDMQILPIQADTLKLTP
jgi:hypothetical protein